MTKQTRRKFTGKEKVAILKRHLLEGKAVSDVCDALADPFSVDSNHDREARLRCYH